MADYTLFYANIMQNKNKKRKRMYAQFMFSRVKKKFYEILKRMEIN